MFGKARQSLWNHLRNIKSTFIPRCNLNGRQPPGIKAYNLDKAIWTFRDNILNNISYQIKVVLE